MTEKTRFALPRHGEPEGDLSNPCWDCGKAETAHIITYTHVTTDDRRSDTLRRLCGPCWEKRQAYLQQAQENMVRRESARWMEQGGSIWVEDV